MQFTWDFIPGSISGSSVSTRFADQRLNMPLRSSVGQTAKSSVPFALRMIESSDGARPELKHIQRTSSFDELRNLAVSRIYLDNFDHITAYWISLGLPMAALALNYGVDDLHGTIMDEKIFHMAGAHTPLEQSVTALRKAIIEAGRDPVQRDTWYRPIEQRSTEQEPRSA